jgi:tRNA nucleotidyltransferase (CCA-adding enzyme)
MVEERQQKLQEVKPREALARPKRGKMSYELSCGVLIFHIYKKEPHYLLIKYPTYWGFVKGLVEPGENEEKTAFREADEEVGITDLYFFKDFRESQHWFYRHYKTKKLSRKEAIYLLARTKSWKVKISHEHENYRWCTYQEAVKLIKVRAIKKLLTKANDYIIKKIGKL